MERSAPSPNLDQNLRLADGCIVCVLAELWTERDFGSLVRAALNSASNIRSGERCRSLGASWAFSFQPALLRDPHLNIEMALYNHLVGSKKREAQSKIVEMIQPREGAYIAVITGGTA